MLLSYVIIVTIKPSQFLSQLGIFTAYELVRVHSTVKQTDRRYEEINVFNGKPFIPQFKDKKLYQETALVQFAPSRNEISLPLCVYV